MAWALNVLTDDGLDHILAHKYNPGSYTALDMFLNPFWQGLAEVMPRWLAPNTITFMGFVPVVAVFTLGWFTVPLFDVAPPRWLALAFAVALYFYQTLDAVDGKQARRTGAASPMGHLIDHGCDCLTGLSQHSALSLVVMPGDASWVLFCMRAIQSDIFLAAWQDCHIHEFPTSYGPVGVTESQFMLIFAMLFAGIFGPEVWGSWMSAAVGLPWGSESVGMLILKAFILQCIGLALACFVKVFTSEKCKKAAALKDLLPILSMNILASLWQPAVVSTAPRVIGLCTGLSFFWMNAQMIVFSMARMEFPVFQKIQVPYAALVVMSWGLPPDWSRRLLCCYTLVLGCWVLWWLLSVVQQLKAKLGIYCFCITKKYEVDNGSKKTNGIKKTS